MPMRRRTARLNDLGMTAARRHAFPGAGPAGRPR